MHYGDIRRSLVDIAESVNRTFDLIGAKDHWRGEVKRRCEAVEELRFSRDWSRLERKHADKANGDKNLSNTQGKRVAFRATEVDVGAFCRLIETLQHPCDNSTLS